MEVPKTMTNSLAVLMEKRKEMNLSLNLDPHEDFKVSVLGLREICLVVFE